MMFPDFGYGETIQHHRWQGGGKDPDGYRLPQYAAPVDVQNVGVDQPTTTEPRDGTTERAQVDLVIFLPAGYTCDYRDRFTIRGKLYQAESVGEPLRNFFTGDLARTEVSVRRADG